MLICLLFCLLLDQFNRFVNYILVLVLHIEGPNIIPLPPCLRVLYLTLVLRLYNLSHKTLKYEILCTYQGRQRSKSGPSKHLKIL